MQQMEIKRNDDKLHWKGTCTVHKVYACISVLVKETCWHSALRRVLSKDVPNILTIFVPETRSFLPRCCIRNL